MRKIIIISGFLLMASCLSYGQEVNKQVVKDSLKGNVPPIESQVSSSSESGIEPIVNFNKDLPTGTEHHNINPKAIETSVDHPGFTTWNNGMMAGYHGYMQGPFSYGNFSSVGAIQQWGDFSVMGGINLSKGAYNGIGIVNAVSGNVLVGYQINDNLSLHAFGGIGNTGFMGPAPNMTNAYYGGYLTLTTNNQKWGMDVGARTVYNSMTGRWETIPIAMPYYNLNGAKLGFDFGGLLYGIFRNAAYNKEVKEGKVDLRRGPAIIAPPVNPMPHYDAVETPEWVQKQNKNQF